MRIEEAQWISDRLTNYYYTSKKLLNIGSSTKAFRQIVQPHIDSIVFSPLADKLISVVHCDIKSEPGIDIVANILDPDSAEQLKKLHFDIFLCSNVLEHIDDLSAFCEALERIMDTGAELIITVPNIYPYHKDPIDTKFRPEIDELASLFGGCELIEGIILTSEESHFDILVQHPWNLLLTIKNWCFPRYGFDDWSKRLKDIPNVFKNYKMACAVFKKK